MVEHRNYLNKEDCRNLLNTDMTIHWKALEEHFLMVQLVLRFDFQGKYALITTTTYTLYLGRLYNQITAHCKSEICVECPPGVYVAPSIYAVTHV
jgi:hypothetical protein